MADTPSGDWVGLPLDVLTDKRTKVLAALDRVLTIGQAYVPGGSRQYTLANLNDLKKMLGDINYAISLQSTTSGGQFAYADMSV